MLGFNASALHHDDTCYITLHVIFIIFFKILVIYLGYAFFPGLQDLLIKIVTPLFVWQQSVNQSGKLKWSQTRTKDAQRGNCLYCTAENSIPIPNFEVRSKHILSTTSAQFFGYLWFMPSLGVCSP